MADANRSIWANSFSDPTTSRPSDPFDLASVRETPSERASHPEARAGLTNGPMTIATIFGGC